MEEELYTKKDIFVNSTQLDSIKAITTSYYTSDFIGHIVQSMHLKIGALTHNLMTSCRIELNNTLSYWIIFADPKLQFLTASPTAFPRTHQTILEDAGNLLMYLEAIC